MATTEELESVLRMFEQSLAEGDAARARELLPQLRACAGEDDVVVEYAHAGLAALEDDPEAAAEHLRRVIARDPEHADAHYDLACLAEDAGDGATMVAHYLRVRALDARADRELGIGTEEELAHIEQVARDVLERLPATFAERLAHVPIMIERRPSRALVEDGFDPRALGIFDGPTDGNSDVPAPTSIILFAANLLAEFPDEPELSEQIEVTVLHEVGHFFNLDEEQLARLGLD